VVEVLGTTALDFIVIDAEHAPFDRQQLDVSILAARAGGLAVLVRVPNGAPDTVLNVLDVGATGLLVPHALGAADVRQVLASARYRGGVRGFSNSPRAGGYGAIGMAELVETADRDISVVCQIEDREAVERIEEIVAIDEVDCLFIGRADLAVSYATFDIGHERVDQAVKRVCAACADAGKAVGIFLGDGRELERYEDLGASLFVIGSDQAMLRAHAAALVKLFARTEVTRSPA
jgi:2-keto-3-deoxy-L-rhamnonate aldolase RhmA